MAKAIVALRTWRRVVGSTRDDAIAAAIEDLFAAELYAGNAQVVSLNV